MSTYINLRTHALMIMHGDARVCMSLLNQMDILPSSVHQTPGMRYCLLVVPQYAVSFIQTQLATCLCNFPPPRFAATVDEVRKTGLCYTPCEYNSSCVYISSPTAATLKHITGKVVPFILKRGDKRLVSHTFNSWKGYTEKCKILRQKQKTIHRMESERTAAESTAVRERCARSFAAHILRKHLRREAIGRAFAKWVVRTTITPPPSPRLPSKKKKKSKLEKAVSGIHGMKSLRSFLQKYRPEALSELEDAIAMAEVSSQHSVLQAQDTNQQGGGKKIGNARKLLAVINKMLSGKKPLTTVIGEIKRAMADQNVKYFDDIAARIQFSGCVRVKQYKPHLNSWKIPKEWTMDSRKDALDYIMFRPMDHNHKDFCLLEWILSKHPGDVPSLTDALGTVAEGFNARVGDLQPGVNTYFDLLCEVRSYIFKALGKDTPFVRRVPGVDNLKMVERCLEPGRLRGRKVVGGIPCSSATIGLLTEIMLGFTGRTDAEDKGLLVSICGGKEKADRLWRTVEMMRGIAITPSDGEELSEEEKERKWEVIDCPWINCKDFEILMGEEMLVDAFVDPHNDDFDRYNILRGLFGVMAMKQSQVRALKENMTAYRGMDDEKLQAVAVSLSIPDTFISPIYTIFLTLVGRAFLVDEGISIQSTSASYRAKKRQQRSRSRTRSPQARSPKFRGETKFPPSEKRDAHTRIQDRSRTPSQPSH